MRLAVAVTSHGFGHATRTAEVLRELRRQVPGVEFLIRAPGREALFREAIGSRFEKWEGPEYFGLAQRSALDIDLAETARLLSGLLAGYDSRLAEETERLHAARVDAVLLDTPPLLFEASSRANVPSFGIANFSWSANYRHYSRANEIDPLGARTFAAASERLATSESHATAVFELPFTCDLSSFQRRERVPLIARASRTALSRREVCRRLGVDSDRPLILVSFGGEDLAIGGRAFEHSRFAILETTPHPKSGRPGRMSTATIEGLGLEYVDLVAASDIVLSKPGYGIVTDAIANGSRLLFTDRGDFPEYPVMVREMPSLLPCQHVSREEIADGEWIHAAEGLLSARRPEVPRIDGASVIADRIVTFLRGSEAPPVTSGFQEGRRR